jgi:hypothetical protein
MGRPILKHIADVENELGELRVKIWRQQTSNREHWTSVVKDTMVVRGSLGQGLSKISEHLLIGSFKV